MRFVIVGLLVTVIAALGAGSAAPAPTSTTVNALVWQGRTLSLASLDARSLVPRGRALALGRAHGEVSTDRLGERLAVASAGAGIVVVDTRRMKVLWRLERGRLVRAISWLSPGRLLVAEHGGVLLLDTVRRRIVARADFDGVVLASAKWGDGLALLAFRNEGSIEPARLFIVGPGARVRGVELSRIAAGWASGPTRTTDINYAQPGLAVDVDGGRAFVVGGPYLATIDLASLEVTYSGAERMLQKMSTGPRRSAVWLDDGVLAVAGSDERLSGTTLTSTPLGLRYVSQGGIKVVDERATQVSRAGTLALAYGQRYASGQIEGMGLAAYDGTGALRWRLFGDAPISGVQVARGLGYVFTSGRWNVIEVATGAIVGTPARPRWDHFRVVG